MTELSALSMIKASMPLSRYIERVSGAKLTPNGTNKYRTTCVIHGGDNPTGMTVDDKLGLWHCFTSDCGGGSIIDLWLKQNNSTDFAEAIQGLGAELNIQLPERESNRPSMRRVYDALDSVSKAAAEYLGNSSEPEAVAARRYLKSRKMRPSLAKRWEIGMLPSGYSALDFILEACNDKEALVESGVITRKDESGGSSYWVPLNGRLLFPIADGRGRVVAFGGRIIDDVDHSMAGKYVNTSETVAYSKSSILYGMDLIKPSTEHLVLVEGYMDAIAMNEAITDENTVAVAACGVAVTKNHVDIMSKFKTVTMVFDGDTAGQKAVLKSMWTANQLGDRVGVVVLGDDPEGGKADPWSLWVQGSERVSALTQEAIPIMSMAVQLQWKMLDENEFDLTEWLRSIVPTLTYSQHRDQLMGDAARILGRSPVAYKRALALPINIDSKRTSATDGTLSMSPHTKALCSALLQMDDADRDGVLAGLRPWTSRIDSAVRNWLPATTDMDVAVIKKLTLGVDGEIGPQVDRIIASIMSVSEESDLCVILRGMAKQLLSAVSTMEPVPESIASQVRNIRRSLEASKNPKLQGIILAYLIDVSIDVERLALKTQNESVAAAS